MSLIKAKNEEAILKQGVNNIASLFESMALSKEITDTKSIFDESIQLSEASQVKNERLKTGILAKTMFDNIARTDTIGASVDDQTQATLGLNFLSRALESSSIKLSQTEVLGRQGTVIGDMGTGIDFTLYEYPAMIEASSPQLENTMSAYVNGQNGIYQVQEALTGVLGTSARGAISATTDAPTFTANRFAGGYFGGRIALDMFQLALLRNPTAFDGQRDAYAISRSIAKLGVQTAQLMNIIAYRSRVENTFDYAFSPYSSAALGAVAYGRPTENSYALANKIITNNGDGSFSYNPASQALQQLMTLVVNPQNGILVNNKDIIKGLQVNTQTSTYLALQSVDQANTPLYLAWFMANKSENSAQGIMSSYSAIPELIEVPQLARLGTNLFGAVNDVEYYLPTGYMLPLFDSFNAQPMNGMFTFFYNERVAWLSNMQGLPNNMSPMSDPRAVGLRVVTSMDTHAEDPSASIEVSLKTLFHNMFAANDYIIDLTSDAV
jgi:hypothetical protein